MFISQITITNFRAYKGINTVSYAKSVKNVYLVAGNNGFGKTTFLTSLVWCLYGKLMGDVDDKFRKEINDNQGYKNFAKSNLNKQCISAIEEKLINQELKKELVKNGYSGRNKSLKSISQYSIEIDISDVFIPSIPCSTISVKRTYDYITESENVEVLIDGQTNELAREVGYDIFINDFILSKDIAKFFFFDAEKIVHLAEVKSLDEKRRLSSAYSEVLGIKKYEDIKRNLENLRVKYRKNAGTSGAIISRTKLERLTTDISNVEQKMTHIQNEIQQLDDETCLLKSEREQLHEKLIREGNAMSIEELCKQKDLLSTLRQKDQLLKAKLKDMLDIAPFAISGKLFVSLKNQVAAEKTTKQLLINNDAINSALIKTHSEIIKKLSDIGLNDNQDSMIKIIIENAFASSLSHNLSSEGVEQTKVILDFSPAEENEFQSLYDKIIYSYSALFKQLVKDIKNNSLFLVKTQKRINQVEGNDSGSEIKSVRERKDLVDKRLIEIDKIVRAHSEDLGVLAKDLAVKKKQLSEVLKSIRVDDQDKEKDVIAERLIEELSTFLLNLKNKRKLSLANKIKSEIDSLMHKENFIHNVRIDIKDDIIEIILLDANGDEIIKDKLSKGEQQLYATAILKALVDESGISFPVFIDSPLQKFDSIHAHNIITKFYPNVAKQVVIFPLLGKELSKEEYGSMLPYVNGVYVIANKEGVSSIIPKTPEDIFNNFEMHV